MGEGAVFFSDKKYRLPVGVSLFPLMTEQSRSGSKPKPPRRAKKSSNKTVKVKSTVKRRFSRPSTSPASYYPLFDQIKKPPRRTASTVDYGEFLPPIATPLASSTQMSTLVSSESFLDESRAIEDANSMED